MCVLKYKGKCSFSSIQIFMHLRYCLYIFCWKDFPFPIELPWHRFWKLTVYTCVGPYVCGSIFGFSILSHLSIVYSFANIIALWYCKVNKFSHFVVLLKTGFAYSVLHFYTHFRICLSISTTKIKQKFLLRLYWLYRSVCRKLIS